MDVARPGRWTPHIILFSLILHVVVIYYLAVTFKVVPPLIPDTAEPPSVEFVMPKPPPPPDPTTDPIKLKPPFPQRMPAPAPVPTTVDPTPITPTVGPTPPGPIGMDVRGEIGEQPVSRSLPGYPPMALNRNIEGVVILSITIMPDGSVRDVQVVEANPRGYFERAAVRSVQTWRYRPSNMVRRNVIVRMDFELKDA